MIEIQIQVVANLGNQQLINPSPFHFESAAITFDPALSGLGGRNLFAPCIEEGILNSILLAAQLTRIDAL